MSKAIKKQLSNLSEFRYIIFILTGIILQLSQHFLDFWQFHKTRNVSVFFHKFRWPAKS